MVQNMIMIENALDGRSLAIGKIRGRVSALTH